MKFNSTSKIKMWGTLQGNTSSGKTMLYVELIKEQLQNNKQVLYLLPEIALTTQLVYRLEKLGNISVIL